ncbi:hypothetical protein BAE30_04625 [Acidithiobacillus caldus]|uniref:Uncharacterized protein n=1 Tax=Acidithiobacillus caldus TaxID=33059 RepID=A0A1E7YYF1_9PROT|nr:hypothetical protein BAE30_04625 [Acidithiobacillus caldus]
MYSKASAWLFLGCRLEDLDTYQPPVRRVVEDDPIRYFLTALDGLIAQFQVDSVASLSTRTSMASSCRSAR